MKTLEKKISELETELEKAKKNLAKEKINKIKPEIKNEIETLKKGIKSNKLRVKLEFDVELESYYDLGLYEKLENCFGTNFISDIKLINFSNISKNTAKMLIKNMQESYNEDWDYFTQYSEFKKLDNENKNKIKEVVNKIKKFQCDNQLSDKQILDMF